MRGLSPAAASGGHSSSRCAGLSLSRPLLLRSTGSRRAGSVVVAHGPQLHGVWDLPRPGLEPVSPALAGRFSTTAPPGKPPDLFLLLCFPLLLFTKRILSIHNGLPQGALPLCLNVKPKCLCSGRHPDPVHLCLAARRKKLTHPLPEAGHSREHLQILWPFYFTSSPPPPLCSIAETGIQTPIRWIFWKH